MSEIKYTSPPPAEGFTAYHFDTQSRIVELAVVQVIDADWLVEPSQLTAEKV
jgi:hypothetical protein